MHSRYHKLEVGIVCFLVMAFGCESQAQNLTTRTTGCLGSSGNFSLFALGDAPLQGCPGGENQVSLKLDDLSDGAATVPFFVTLRFGEEQVIAQNGALELRARAFSGWARATASSWSSGARWTAGWRPAPARAPRPKTWPGMRSSCSRRWVGRIRAGSAALGRDG
jgi:hypothetical protein